MTKYSAQKPMGPYSAFRRTSKSSKKAIEDTKMRLNTRLTRIYLGTACDDDFCAIATYLLYGYILAGNFEEIEQKPFQEAVLWLKTVKLDMIKGEINKPLLDAVSAQFEVAEAMVFDLTIGEQEQLQKHVSKHGLAMLNKMQEEV